MSARVVVTRGGVEESWHTVHVAVVDTAGLVVARSGDPTRTAFLRSAAKPFQALPLVEDGVVERYGFTESELALCCASHSSEPRHLAAAASILQRAELGEADLACGPHEPFASAEAERMRTQGERPRAVHNNCSGKHAGMLALARFHGWPTGGYHREGHPVQRRMAEEVARWTGLGPGAMASAVDGCGVLTFAAPLAAMAAAFARLGAAAADGRPGPAAVVSAMTGHPFMVAGSGRLCTDLMEAAGGSVLVKAGAEGVYCAAVPGRGLGVALKVEDGARRAQDPALVAVLEAIGAVDEAVLATLARHRTPAVRNTRGEVVGGLRAEVSLEDPIGSGTR
ncbi:MAG: asparaginase [Gemmatimonadetes bacterium]|nr:asparaginase [Gemmatimonadota bacterium]